MLNVRLPSTRSIEPAFPSIIAPEFVKGSIYSGQWSSWINSLVCLEIYRTDAETEYTKLGAITFAPGCTWSEGYLPNTFSHTSHCVEKARESPKFVFVFETLFLVEPSSIPAHPLVITAVEVALTTSLFPKSSPGITSSVLAYQSPTPSVRFDPHPSDTTSSVKCLKVWSHRPTLIPDHLKLDFFNLL